MSTLKTTNVQVGQSITATNNFTLYQPTTPDGTVRLGVGNSGATTSDVITANSSGNVGIGTSSPAARLDVRTTSSTQATFTRTGQTAVFTVFQSTADSYLSATNSSANLILATQDVERAKIDSSGNWYMNSGYGSSAVAYGCRAWVNFNGTGTIAIRASGNVTSLTDNGVGNYSVNFTNAMPDANYATVGTARSSGISNGMTLGTISVSTSSANVSATSGSANAALDTSEVCVAIFR